MNVRVTRVRMELRVTMDRINTRVPVCPVGPGRTVTKVSLAITSVKHQLIIVIFLSSTE